MNQRTTTDAQNDLALRLEELVARLLDALVVHPQAPPPALLLTSARAREGKTTIALALARVMARVTDEPILLVDANLHVPGLATKLGLPPGPGLADALRATGGGTPVNIFKHPVFEGVSAITAGSEPHPVLLSRGRAVGSFRDQHTHGFRCIIFDGAENRLGGAALGKHVDGVVLTIDSSSTRREVIQGAITDMRLPEGRILGAVLNKRKHYIPKLFYKGL